MHPNEFSQFISIIKRYPHIAIQSTKLLSNTTNERNSEPRRLHYFNPIIINNTLPITSYNNFLQAIVTIIFSNIKFMDNHSLTIL